MARVADAGPLIAIAQVGVNLFSAMGDPWIADYRR
jgi:hypothetical protein